MIRKSPLALETDVSALMLIVLSDVALPLALIQLTVGGAALMLAVPPFSTWA